jgi:hypothetical protein
VVLQLGSWVGLTTPCNKNQHVMKCYTGPWTLQALVSIVIEPFGSIKDGKFLDKLNSNQLLKKYFVP